MGSGHVISDEVRSDLYKHLLKHISSFIAQMAVLMTLALGWAQLDLPFPALKGDVEQLNGRIDDLSLVVLYEQKSQILSEISTNELNLETKPANERRPFLVISRHLNQKLSVVEKSIRDLER